MKEIQTYIRDKTAQRDKLWQKRDQAIATKEKLIKNFSGRLDSPTNAQPISPLSSHNLPPDEVNACLRQLESLESKISQENSNIQSYKNSVEELKTKSRNLIIGLILAGVTFLTIIIVMIQSQSQNNNKSPQPSSLNIQKDDSLT